MNDRVSETRRQRVEKREKAILAAARKVFGQHGFEKARIAEIAKKAGVAEGTVYLYFENKNAILLSLLATFYDRLTREAADGIEEIEGTTERLAFLARHHLELVAREWRILGLASALYRVDQSYADSETYQLNRAYVAVFDRVVREGVLRGELRNDVPLSLLRDIFYGSLAYAVQTLQLRRTPTKSDFDKVTQNFIHVLGSGLFDLPSKPADAPDVTQWESLTGRLENVLDRMEAVSAKAGR